MAKAKASAPTRRTAPWTPEELALIERERARWLAVGLSTERCDPAQVQATWAALYRRAGREPVPTIVVSGPLAAHAAMARWRAGMDPADTSIPAPPTTYQSTWFWGSQEVYWIARYQTARLLGVAFKPEDVERLDEYSEIQHMGWAWPHENGCVVMDRPTVCRMEEATPTRWRLHCADGPALAYGDGYALYAWHGVRMPAHVIEHPDQITPEQITAEPNAEVRRVMLDRFGAERYLTAVKAVKVQADDTGELYRLRLAEGDEVCVVKVFNSTAEPDGTFKPYYLPVPSECETARAAVAWTFGIENPDHYQLAFES